MADHRGAVGYSDVRNRFEELSPIVSSDKIWMERNNPVNGSGPIESSPMPTANFEEDSLGERSSNFSLSNATDGEMKKYCRQLFDMFDEERRGAITAEELREHCGQDSEEVAELILSRLDLTENKNISFQDFYLGFRSVAENLKEDRPVSPISRTDFLRGEDTVYELDPSIDEDRWRDVMIKLNLPDDLSGSKDLRSLWLRLYNTSPALLPSLEKVISEIAAKIDQSNENITKLEQNLSQKDSQLAEQVSLLQNEIDDQLKDVISEYTTKGTKHEKSLAVQYETIVQEKDERILELTKQVEHLGEKLKQQKSAEDQSLKVKSQQLTEALEEKEREDVFIEPAPKIDPVQQILQRKPQKLINHNYDADEDEDLEEESLEFNQMRPDTFPSDSVEPYDLRPHRESLLEGRQNSVLGKYLTTSECDGISSEAVDLQRLRRKRQPHGESPDRDVPEADHLKVGLITHQEEQTLSKQDNLEPDTYQLHELPHTKEVGTNATSNATSTIHLDGTLNERKTPRPSRMYKVVLLGDSGVGKTSLIQSICKAEDPLKTEPTIGVDFHTTVVKVDGEKVALQLWDTAGQERFAPVSAVYLRRADAVILVYDISNLKSFMNINKWFEGVKASQRDDDCIVFIVGCKADLKEKACISTQQATQKATALKLAAFQVSSVTGDNVTEILDQLAKKLLQQENDRIKVSKSLQARETPVQSKCSC